MTTQRCMRSFLGPVKRTNVTLIALLFSRLPMFLLTRKQIVQSPRPYTQTLSRTRSSRADDDANDRNPGPRDGKLMNDLMADLESGDMPLDERLQHMGLDPKVYKAYGNRRWIAAAGSVI
jgi:small subunit ribosomal protein S10